MERQAHRRRRPALACLECRRRKIKCDRSDPCSHCVSSRSKCVFKTYVNDKPNDSAKSPQIHRDSSWISSPSSYTNSSKTVAQPHEANANRPIVEHSKVDPPFFPRVAVLPPLAIRQNATPNCNAVEHTEIQKPEHSHSKVTEPDIHDLLRRVQRLEDSSNQNTISGLGETGRDILARQSGLHDSQIILNKTRTLRSSHWLGTAREFATVYSCYAEAAPSPVGPNDNGGSYQEPETRTLIDQMCHLLQKCKDLARKLKVGRPSRHLSGSGFGFVPPSREVADTMATLYFRSFESSHRILHAPTFWKEYQRYWDSPDATSNGLRLKVLLVVGLGLSLHKQGDADAELRHMVHQWVYAAQSWLSGPLEKDRLDVTGLQVHCLTILARQVFSVGGDLVWMSMGSLVHKAMQIGLNRDPKHLPSMTVLQAETRRRLWATILEMLVQSSLDSAMPPRISMDEFDTEAPSNVNDEEIDESTTQLLSYPRNVYTATSIQLLLFDFLPIRLQILRLLNGLRFELSYLDVLGLSSEIIDACQACSSFLEKNESYGVTPFQRNLLDYHLRRFLIPLHCAFAIQARTNPLFYYSLKISLDAAMAMISPESDAQFSRLMAIGGGMFREGIRCAIAVISFELIAKVEARRSDGILQSNPQHKEQLKQAVRNLISFSAERIRQGETNIKGHMFLTMVLAQVEAMEAGTPREFKIAESAVGSLKFCYELLEAQVGSGSVPSPNGSGLTTTNNLDGGHESDGWALDFDFDFFLPNAGFS